jgi:hypothetical protein
MLSASPEVVSQDLVRSKRRGGRACLGVGL